MSKKKTANYKSDKELQKNEFVQLLYDLISSKYYKYKKINRDNVVKYYAAQCKKLRKEVDKRNYDASILLGEVANKGIVQIIVSWHTEEEPHGSYYFVHTNSYIAGEEAPDCKKLGEF